MIKEERLYSFSEIGRENIVTVLGNLDTVIIKKEIKAVKEVQLHGTHMKRFFTCQNRTI